MKGSIETLKRLTEGGARNFIFTHRDNLTFDILKNIKMDGYFEEIVTCERGFGWKPSPNGVNYIVDTYGLNRDKTFYVGDRNLDIECGFNAGIGTVFFRDEDSVVQPCGKETYIIKNLEEIPTIFGM